MTAVETLREAAKMLDEWSAREYDGSRWPITDCVDALADQLAHVDPAVLDLAAVVAANVAAAPLPDGWTAVAVGRSSVKVQFPGGDDWVWVERDDFHDEWVGPHDGEVHAHLADVVAAVTGTDR